MQFALRPYLATGLAIVGAGLTAVSPAAPVSHGTGSHEIRLTSSDTAASALGDGTALIMGGSTIPVPGERYVDTLASLFLAPHGFGGDAQGLFTPEGLYPLTGVKSLPLDQSVQQGQAILDATILRDIADGHVSAANPLVVMGWSQSAIIASLTMSQLAEQGVPADDLHFVLLGDVTAPDGGFLSRFHVPIDGQIPTVPALGITFDAATPSDLYPTDVYTTEYDLFADFPRYPLDFLADLNAYLGLIAHASYPALTAGDVASAIALPTSSADTLTDYYMIPTQALPLLEPLQLLPVIGQPLYDLLEPDMKVLVNLGYGSIDNGWDPSPADVPTTFGLFPTDLNWGQVGTALAEGVPAGINAALKDLADPANYQLSTVLNGPLPTMLVSLVHTLGYTDATTPSELTSLPQVLEMARNALSGSVGFPTSDASIFTSSPTEIINAISGTLSADYATLLPIADTVNTLLTTVPSVLAGFVGDQLAQGNVLDAIGDPIAAGLGLVPFAVLYGTGIPLAEALGGTLVNLADLVGLGG